MIRLDYTFTAVSPIHTGSDTNAGTTRTLRRQKIILQEPVTYESNYTDEPRRDAIVDVLYAIHKSIDWDSIKGTRLMGIWDEMYSKVLKAAGAANRHQFFQGLCDGWDIRSVHDIDIVDTLNSLNDEELLSTLRDETQYLILKLRQRVKSKGQASLFDREQTPSTYTKTFEMIPNISGNSIRGKLRRLVMYDYCRLAGIEKLSASDYHTLFTGGVLDDSTRYEDIDKREKLIEMCPMLAVLGAAIGNMTIEGMLAVGMAYPVCSELGTGEKSYWEYLDTIFQTRLDSSKTEQAIEIDGKSESTVQMKYEYEVFSPGTPFNHGFRMMELDEIAVSAFWHLLKLFKQNPFVGGMGAIGNGEICLVELEDGDDSAYLAHIEKKAGEIREFFK